MKEIKNTSGEILATIGENGEIIPVHGKELDLIKGMFLELNSTKMELSECKKQLNVAAVLEKSIREGLIK